MTDLFGCLLSPCRVMSWWFAMIESVFDGCRCDSGVGVGENLSEGAPVVINGSKCTKPYLGSALSLYQLFILPLVFASLCDKKYFSTYAFDAGWEVSI